MALISLNAGGSCVRVANHHLVECVNVERHGLARGHGHLENIGDECVAAFSIDELLVVNCEICVDKVNLGRGP